MGHWYYMFELGDPWIGRCFFNPNFDYCWLNPNVCWHIFYVFLLYQFDSCSHIFLIFPWVRFIVSQSYLCVLQPRLEGKFENKNGCLCTRYQCNGTHTYIPQNPEKLLNELNMYQDVGIRHQILFFLIL